jgi:hypothetical protein
MDTSPEKAPRRWTQTDITALRSGILAGHSTGELARALSREIGDITRMASRLHLTLRSEETTKSISP